MTNCVEFVRNKKISSLKQKIDRPIWFINFMPRELFYLQHADGDFALFNMVCTKIQSLQAQILSFASEYLKVHVMNEAERRALKKARVEVFKSVMRTPEVQCKFVAGIPKKDICQSIYDQQHELFHVDHIKNPVVEGKYSRMKKTKVINRGRMRDCKYTDSYQFEPESGVTVAITSFLIPSLLGVAISSYLNYTEITKVCKRVESYIHEKFTGMYNNVIATTQVMSLSMNHANQRVDSVANTVEEVLRAWTPMSLINLTREENPVLVIRLVEIHTLLNLLYEWQFGTKGGALRFASYFMYTRSSTFVSSVSSLCSYFYPTNVENDLEQHFEPEAKNLVDICGQIATFLASNSLGNFSSADLQRANAEFAYLNGKRKNVEDRVGMACSVISVVSRLLFSFDPFNYEFQNFSYRVLMCVDYVNSWNLRTPTTNEELENIVETYKSYQDLPTNALMNSIPSYLKQLFTVKFQKLESMASEANNTLVGDIRRVEPVVLLLVGKPASGKTTAMNFIKQAIANKQNNGKVENYSMNLQAEYFEGYRNQMFVTMDDMFTTTDTKERAQEAKNIINMTNSTPYNLNMAFGEKGKKFFNSKYLLITSNSLRPDHRLEAGLTDNEAFMRRCHIRAFRDEPCTGDSQHDLFEITHCQQFPMFVGHKFNAGQLANLMMRAYVVHENRYNLHTVDANVFDLDAEQYSLPPIMEVENGFLTSIDPASYVRMFFRVTSECANKWWQEGWISFLVILFMALATVTVCAKLFFPEVNFEVETHDERKRKRNPRNNRRRKEKNQRRLAMGRGRMNLESHVETEQMLNSISRCVVHMSVQYLDNDVPHTTNCVAHHVKDNIYMLPAHFYDDVDGCPAGNLQVYTCNGNYTIPFPEEEAFFGPEDLDVLFVELKLPQKPNEMYKYLVSEENDQIVENLGDNCPLGLLGRSVSGVYNKDVVKSKISKSIEYDCGENHYYLSNPITYDALTQPGDSGAAICYVGSDGRTHVIGIHSGRMLISGQRLGAALPISKELVDILFDTFIPQSSHFPLEIIGTVPYGVPIPTHSRIKKSKMYGYKGSPKYIPAKMSPFVNKDGIMIDPRLVALSKLSQVPTPETCS